MRIGDISFIVGFTIAILAGILTGFVTSNSTFLGLIILALVLLGIIVGFLNVTEKETTAFLIAGIALLTTSLSGSVLSIIPYVGIYLNSIVDSISVFVAPAIIIVAIKAIYALARN